MIQYRTFINEDGGEELAPVPVGGYSNQYAYAPLEAMDLEALGIDASVTSREAHTAIQQLHWFKGAGNLRWALYLTERRVEERGELLSELVAELRGGESRPGTVRESLERHWPPIASEEREMDVPDIPHVSNHYIAPIELAYQREGLGLVMRDAGGALTPKFIDWYVDFCVFDERTGERAYSWPAYRRGDHGDIGDGEEAPEAGGRTIARKPSNVLGAILSHCIIKLRAEGVEAPTYTHVIARITDDLHTGTPELIDAIARQGYTADVWTDPEGEEGLKLTPIGGGKPYAARGKTIRNRISHIRDHPQRTSPAEMPTP
jgi:hypothetical protein